MAINPTDIKIYESEKMNEDADAGGKITSTALVCGAANNMFPNISRIDRLRGRTQLRKVFPKVISQNTDVYSGCHVIVKEVPDDENVSITLFDNGTKDNMLDSGTDKMMDFFEAHYIPFGSLGTATLAFDSSVGSYQLTFKLYDWDRTYELIEGSDGHFYREWQGTSSTWELTVNSGDVCIIDSEYIQVQKVETVKQVLIQNEWRRKGTSYLVLTLVSPLSALKVAGLGLFGTQLNSAWKCYGTTTLSATAAAGSLELSVTSEKVRIMPTINLPSEVEGYFPFGEPGIVDGITVGSPPNTWTLNGIEQPMMSGYKQVSSGTVYLLNLRENVLAGSVVIKIRYQNQWKTVTDDGAGALTGYGAGTVDYNTGLVSVNFVGAPDSNTHILYTYNLEIGYNEFENDILALGPPAAFPVALDYGRTNLKSGSAFIEYADTGRTLTVFEDGNGFLKFLKDFQLDTANLMATYEAYTFQWDNRDTNFLNPMLYHEGFFWAIDVDPDAGGYSLMRSADGIMFSTDQQWSDLDMPAVGAGIAYCDVRNRQFIFGYEGAPAYQTFGYRWGITGAFTFGGFATAADIIGGVCAGGYLMVSATNYTVGIYAINTGTLTDVLVVPNETPSVFAVGTDGSGNERVIAFSSGVLWYCDGPDYNVPGNWVSRPFPITGTVRWAEFDPRFEVWAACSSNADVVFSQDGGITWISKRTELINDVPTYGGAGGYNLSQICTDGNGSFIVVSSTGGNGIIAYTSTKGASWSTVNVNSVSSLGGSSAMYSVQTNRAGILSGTALAVGVPQFQAYAIDYVSYADLPDIAGTLDVNTGTGALTAGPLPLGDVMSRYVLQNLFITDFAFILETEPPIETNTTICAAKALTDFSDLSISETGGALVGDIGADDAFWTSQINHTHGYIIIRFDQAVVPQTIEVGVRGTCVFHPLYEEFDTDRMPTSGLVPGFKVGDTIVIAKRTIPYDNLSGSFSIGETITGSIGGQQWEVVDDAASILTVKNRTGTTALVDGETMTGGTSGATADVNSVDGVIYVEEMAIVTGVNKGKITIAVEGGLSTSYPAGTLISNAIVAGDRQASAGTYFSEQTWPGWFDTQQGAPADGTWDSTNFPPTVTNNGAITERWRIEVVGTAPTRVNVVGESVGIVLTNFNLYSGDIQPPSQLTDPYFVIPQAGWSIEGTHQFGNVYRFNTTGTEVPLWVCRTIDAQSSPTTIDDFVIEVRGDVAAP